MAFTRIVEVFPPLIPSSKVRGTQDAAKWLSEIRGVVRYSDIFLVASLKDPGLVKMSTIEASYLIEQRLGVRAAPVLVVRAMGRGELLSSIFTCVSAGLKSVMLALGDKDSKQSRGSRDFGTLGEAIKEASAASLSWGGRLQILAPVDLRKLREVKGREIAKSRVAAGASLLLAQPPTTDDGPAFSEHLRLIGSSGLAAKVILNVFPFRGTEDIAERERKFGWQINDEVRQAASKGERALLKEERAVVRRIRSEGMPGVYLSTRGEPRIARKLLS